MEARTGSLELNVRSYRWNQEGTKNCLMCRCGDEETIEHCMVECKAYDDERDDYMQKLILLIGWGKWREITGKKDQGMGYILGFGNDVPLNIVEETKIYLEKL